MFDRSYLVFNIVFKTSLLTLFGFIVN